MAKHIVILGRGGAINAQRVLAVANARSNPIQRMIEATDISRVLNMTYGYPRRSVVILDNGYIVLSHRSPDAMAKALGFGEEMADEDDQPPWW